MTWYHSLDPNPSRQSPTSPARRRRLAAGKPSSSSSSRQSSSISRNGRPHPSPTRPQPRRVVGQVLQSFKHQAAVAASKSNSPNPTNKQQEAVKQLAVLFVFQSSSSSSNTKQLQVCSSSQEHRSCLIHMHPCAPAARTPSKSSITGSSSPALVVVILAARRVARQRQPSPSPTLVVARILLHIWPLVLSANQASSSVCSRPSRSSSLGCCL